MPLSPQTLCWSFLPAELQLIILERLAEEHEIEQNDDPEARKYQLADYACVCKSWQSFFEAKTFRHLILEPSDIGTFDRVVSIPRRRHVKHILLHIRIAIYNHGPNPATDIDRRHELKNEQKNDAHFTDTMRRLWSILACWETQGANGNTGLTLEIGVESLGAYHYRQDILEYLQSLRKASPTLDQNLSIRSLNKHCVEKCYFEGYQTKPLEFNFDDTQPNLPQVEVISDFQIPRRWTPSFSSKTLAQIFQSLVRLRSIRIEHLRNPKRDVDERWEDLIPELPHLTTFSIYEAPLPRWHGWHSDPNLFSTDLLKHLIKIARHLEHLSISFLLDADKVFQLDPFSNVEITASHFKSLTSLAFTCTALTSKSNLLVNEHLLRTAKIVQHLPKLKILEVWHQRKVSHQRNLEAAIFRYQKTEAAIEIVWLGSWKAEFEERLLQAWQAINNGREVEIHYRPLVLPWDGIERDLVLEHSKLRALIFQEVSFFEQVGGNNLTTVSRMLWRTN